MIETLFIGLLTELLGINLTDTIKRNETKRNEVRDLNFTANEIGTIASRMGNNFTMRISPMGNPILTHRETEGNNVIFSFYKHDDGIIVRRRLGYSNPFGSGNVLNGGKPFANITKAMDYFDEYKRKYPHSLIG